MILSDAFRRYLEEAIGGDDAHVAFSAFDDPASVSIRINPFKSALVQEGIGIAELLKSALFAVDRILFLDAH